MSKVQTKYKKCRKYGSVLFEKCQTAKYALSEQKKRFSQRGGRRKQISDYGKQLMEKQKIKIAYGLKEKKLKSYILDAINSQKETFSEIYKSLETRLDNVVYKAGLADTRAMAKQMVSHGHITVNGRKLNIPSYQVKVGDKIAVRKESQDRAMFQNLASKDLSKLPAWISFDHKKLEGEIKSDPVLERSEFNLQQVIEYYTR
ncbi:30S ribosomal protein S4 [Candidatus Campbellbacteria bacterium]|nr:MAG: 30S ribosomal protein S4 [Candidatus Campbellbacteria bacterium]